MPERAPVDAMDDDDALDGLFGALLQDDAEALYDRAPCGYLSTAPDGTIVKVNQTFLTWMGLDRSDLVGRRTFAELLTVGGRIYHETHYAPLLRMQGQALEVALEFVRTDGQRLPALVSSVLERSSDGAPVVIRTAVFDARRRRQYEQELLLAKQRAEESEARTREIVDTLQKAVMPPDPPRVDGLDVAVAYRPAGSGDEIGGDFYDIFPTPQGEWIACIGDVQGKGVHAAVVTAVARHAVRAAAMRTRRPSEILHVLNEVLLVSDTDRFCTVAVVRMREAEGGWLASVAVGGHPLPVHAHPTSDPTTIGRFGTIVGILPDAAFTDVEVAVQPGDALVLYTDGVTEARRGREWFGEEGLAAAIRRADPTASSITDTILDEVVAFQDGFLRDDVAIVTIRVSGPA